MNGASEQATSGVESAFAAHVARLRSEGVLGEAGRLRELFDYLADRGAEAAPATQAEIAADVFGHQGVDGDDATVRVYVHRLRKRLEEYYGGAGDADGGRLVIPSGTYALRWEEAGGAGRPPRRGTGPFATGKLPLAALLGLAALLLAAGLILGRFAWPGGVAPPVNAIWAPFIADERPIMVVVGDYYIYGEIDPVRPEEGRLIRDFAINSETDLARAQEADPARYGLAEDYGLSYLPLSSAYGLRALMPVLAQHDRPVAIVAASDIDAESLRDYNVVYLGLLSGMGLLEDVNFTGSNYAVGDTYDEIVDRSSGGSYVSEEARRLASPAYYRDYGYLSVFTEPGGARVAVVAGSRDTGLRALAPIVTGKELPDPLARQAAAGGDFEALFEITGQQGADLSERLIAARERP